MHMRKMMVHALDEHGTQALNSNQRSRWWAWVLSHVQFFETPWTVAHQTPLSMGFSRQEYWSGLPFLSPGELPNPGIEPRSPALQAETLTSQPPGWVQISALKSYRWAEQKEAWTTRKIIMDLSQTCPYSLWSCTSCHQVTFFSGVSRIFLCLLYRKSLLWWPCSITGPAK